MAEPKRTFILVPKYKLDMSQNKAYDKLASAQTDAGAAVEALDSASIDAKNNSLEADSSELNYAEAKLEKALRQIQEVKNNI
jgi:hypothetical protein